MRRSSITSFLGLLLIHLSLLDGKLPRQNLSLQKRLTGIAGVSLLLVLGSSQRIESASDVPSRFIKQQKTIYGRVYSVTDGDTIRMSYQRFPLIRVPWAAPSVKKTIVVRLNAIDCPEIAKRNQPGQPFSKEAKDFVVSRVGNGKGISMKILGRDQYGRILGSVTYREGPLGIFGQRDLSEELLKSGLAVVYRGGNAKYGSRGVGYWNQVEKIAQQRRVGMWIKGTQNVELPSTYKIVSSKKGGGKKTVDSQLQSQTQRNHEEERLASNPDGYMSQSRRGIRKSRYVDAQPNKVSKGKAPGGTIQNDPNYIFSR